VGERVLAVVELGVVAEVRAVGARGVGGEVLGADALEEERVVVAGGGAGGVERGDHVGRLEAADAAADDDVRGAALVVDALLPEDREVDVAGPTSAGPWLRKRTRRAFLSGSLMMQPARLASSEGGMLAGKAW
jgi:hypothetical protein